MRMNQPEFGDNPSLKGMFLFLGLFLLDNLDPVYYHVRDFPGGNMLI